MNSAVYIYALNDPLTGRTRYVGKAKNLLNRLRDHLSRIRCKSRKADWITSLLAQGLKPVLEVLDTVSTAEWHVWEREYIKLYRALFPDLTNDNDGGVGSSNPSSETRYRLSVAAFGRKFTPEHRAKISASNRGRAVSESTRIKISLANTGRSVGPFTPEHRTKIGTANKGHVHSVEARAKMSAKTRGEKHPCFGKHHSLETRAKMKSAAFSRWHQHISSDNALLLSP